jgi:glycosyltransferase involved in cell wall biosynthesis
VRIGYVSSGYLPALGGVERHVAEVATRMAARGHEVDVLAHARDPALPALEHLDGVRVRRFQVRALRDPLAMAPGLWRHLLRHGRRYDVVHAQNYHALAAPAGCLAPVRTLVLTPHYLGRGDAAHLRLLHAAYRPLGAVALRRAARIVCVSHAEAALLHGDFPRLSVPIDVIQNGIDAARLRAARPHRVEGRAVLVAGRLEAYKAFGTAVVALRHLAVDVRLYVAGDGPDRGALERVAEEAGVADRVRFLGRLSPDALHRWLRTAHVYVALSPRECFDIAALEARVAGAAVVASDIPAHRETLAAGGGGGVVFVPPRTGPAPLAAAVERAARAGRPDDAPAPASWDDVAEVHARLYAALAPGR